MPGMFASPPWFAFGPDRLHSPAENPISHHVDGTKPRELYRQLRKCCSQRPGVYGMIDANGDLIYVGKAKRLRTRLLSYFRKRGRDPKSRRIIARTVRIVWEPAASEFAALLRELELIQRWQPRCNVQGRPGLRFRTYVCLGRSPAPYMYLSKKPSPRTIGCFGPIFAGNRTRAAVQHLNDLFQLRDCPSKQTMIFAEAAGLFPVPLQAGCLRLELQTCLGPCAAACTQAAYRRRAIQAREFLKGKDRSLLERLEGEMLAASSAREYEKAARLRDQLELIRGLREQIDRIQRWQDRLSFVYPVRGEAEAEVWYLVHRGQVVTAWRPTRGLPGAARFLEVLQSVRRSRKADAIPVLPGEADGLLLVAAWFRKHPEQLDRTISLRDAVGVIKAASQARIGPIPAAG